MECEGGLGRKPWNTSVPHGSLRQFHPKVTSSDNVQGKQIVVKATQVQLAGGQRIPVVFITPTLLNTENQALFSTKPREGKLHFVYMIASYGVTHQCVEVSKKKKKTHALTGAY